MEKTLDSKFSVRIEQSGDKGLVEEKQKGRWTKWKLRGKTEGKKVAWTFLTLCRWNWPQKAGDGVSPGSGNHSSQTREWPDLPAASPCHYATVSTGEPPESLKVFRLCQNGSKPSSSKSHSVLYQTEDTLSFRESLLNKLEQAEARVQALEAQVKIQKYSYCVCFIDLSNHCDALPFFNWQQLEENSKLWGRQKQDLLTTLNEYRHGFVRTSASILYNEPLVSWTATDLFISPTL